jgi:ectoine hydroxylase-related dioxygenase (phytanoyl-CoA dioxygenase family)
MEFVPLTAEQKRQFEEEGYLIVRNALDEATIAALIEAGDRLVASERTENRQRTPDGVYDGFRNVISMDEAFLTILQNPRTVPLIVQLLGPNLHLITSHLIYKNPQPAGTPTTKRLPGWHRDIAGTPQDLGHANIPRMEMKCAYYLTDLQEPYSGVTMFAPGSNRAKEALPVGEGGQQDPENALTPRLKAGDAVFFENRTWHAGEPNLTDRVTKAVMFGYGYLWLRPFDYDKQSPELTDKVTDPIGQQLLGALKGPEGRFVPGGISTPLREWCKQHGVTYTPAD